MRRSARRSSAMADPAAPATGYVFKPHERPFMPGSPASPDHPVRRKIFYFLIGLYLAIVGGFQNGLLVANLTAMQGHLDLTPVDRSDERRVGKEGVVTCRYRWSQTN